MNYTLVVYIALMMNIFIAGLFPEEVGLNDPFGFEKIQQENFLDLDDNAKAYFIEQGVFNPDGTPAENFNKFKELAEAGEQEKGLLISETLAFIDYFKIAWSTFKSIGIFLIAFIVILFQLPLSISTFIAPIVSTLALFGLVRFIIGR